MTKYKILTKRQVISFTLAVVIFLLALVTVLGNSGGNSHDIAAKNRKIPIYCVEPQNNEKLVAISFDATWGDERTVKLLDIMDEYGVKSTFFLAGRWAEEFPEDVGEIAKRGHEIMNHSMTHASMPTLSKDEMISEIRACNSAIEKITGIKPNLFRPPYGDYDNTLIEALNEEKMYCIQWSVDSLDWKDLSSDEIIRRVTTNIKPGSIVLFHNDGEHTNEALPTIIETLKDDGYKFVMISELIYRDNYTIDHEGKQIQNAVSETVSPD